MKLIKFVILGMLPLNVMIKFGDDTQCSGEYDPYEQFPYFGLKTALYSDSIFGPLTSNTIAYTSDLYFNITNPLYARTGYLEIGLTKDPYLIDDSNRLFYLEFDIKNGFNELTYTLNFNDYFNFPEGTYISYALSSSIGDYIARATYFIKTFPEEYDINTLRASSLSLSSYSFKLGYSESNDEVFRFNNFLDYFTNDRYYRLLIDFLSFEYSSKYSLSYESINLLIQDTNDLFPYLPTCNDCYRMIPLTIIKENNSYSFTYKNKLYVNPISLDMSLEPIDGFQESKYFYLPRGKKDLFDGYNFTLKMNKIGINKASFTFSITFNVGYSIIGDCVNSEYCVVGKVHG